jgi:hypothetical protein
MSKHELIDAYISREINRRTFIQGLTALGVSAGVAASYAVALQPVAAGGGDLYYNDPPDPPADGGTRRRRRRGKKKKKKGNKKND